MIKLSNCNPSADGFEVFFGPLNFHPASLADPNGGYKPDPPYQPQGAEFVWFSCCHPADYSIIPVNRRVSLKPHGIIGRLASPLSANAGDIVIRSGGGTTYDYQKGIWVAVPVTLITVPLAGQQVYYQTHSRSSDIFPPVKGTISGSAY